MGDECPVSVVWDPRFLDYDFGEGHPFTERSRALATKLLEHTGFFAGGHNRLVNSVEPAKEETLLHFHTKPYLSKVRRESSAPEPGMLDQGDTPAFPGVFEASARIVSGTLGALKTVISDPKTHAVNFSGGLHHAAPGRASGFCVFNDIGISISTAFKEGLVGKVAYIDIDAHHGDGVMYGFYTDGRVLDIDFHQDGRTLFPGSGFPQETGEGEGKGVKLNLSLPPGSGDETFIPLFEKVVPACIRDFKPDLIIMQSGIDGHAGDPLAHLNYTAKSYQKAISTLHGLAHEVCGGRILMLGGGGYSPASVPLTLAMEAIMLRGHEPPAHGGALPKEWIEDFKMLIDDEPPRAWGDEPAPITTKRDDSTVPKVLKDLAQHLGRQF